MALEDAAVEDKKRRQQDSAGIERMIGGALSVPVAIARDAANNIGTDIANLGRAAIGGQTVPRPGYPHTANATARAAEGAQVFGQANKNLQGGLRDLTGTAEAKPSIADLPAAQSAAPQQPAAQASSAPAAIPPMIAAPAVMPKPMQAPAAQSAADSAITINGQTPKSIGDGIGTFSQMQAGDSRAALDEFARANAIRAQTIKEGQRGELGNNGGKLTIVRDSSRAPTRGELRGAQLEAMQAQTAMQNQQAQAGIAAGLDARQERALSRTKAEQDLGIGAIQLQNAQQIQQIAQQLADPSLSIEERRALTEQYQAMSGKTPENRFTVAPGGQEIDPDTRQLFNRPSRIFNNQTGQFVDGTTPAQVMAPPAAGETRSGFRFKGGNPADENNWEKV